MHQLELKLTMSNDQNHQINDDQEHHLFYNQMNY